MEHCPTTSMISPAIKNHFWINRFPDWPRTGRSSRSGWLSSPRWSKASPGLRPRSRRWAARRESVLTFLEETFSASTAPPEHRLHQKAAQAVLKALLARERHRHQGTDEIASGIARSLGLREPPQGLRRPDPHPRPRASPDHADRPGRLGRARIRRPYRAGNTTSSRTITWSTPCETG